MECNQDILGYAPQLQKENSNVKNSVSKRSYHAAVFKSSPPALSTAVSGPRVEEEYIVNVPGKVPPSDVHFFELLI